MLVCANFLTNRVVPNADVVVGLALVAGLAAVARGSGLTADDLGLARQTWWSGLRWGGAAAGIVAVGYGIGAAIPAVRQAVTESTLPWQSTVVKAVVVIPFATVIPEEFAFRGVLLGSALRLWGPWRASLVTSALFGLWHIAPTLHTMSDNRAVSGLAASTGGQVLLVLGSIAVTFVAGLVFCWLRLRSRSLIAPVMAHIATNGFALTVAWFAVH